MKVLVAFLLMLGALSEPVQIVVSSPETTTVISPANQQVDLSNYYTTNHPNFLGYGPQWVWLKGPNGWSHQFKAAFQTLFYATCPAVLATLTLQVDDVYSIFLNGASIGAGNIRQTLSFKLNLVCGVNNLTFVVTNLGENTPGAIIFKVTQNQQQCHKCSPSAYFDADSCQCKCSADLSCPSSLKVKVGHPICGCKCMNRLFAACPANKEYNQEICQCQCRKLKCLDGFQQDPKSCICRCKSLSCTQGEFWNYEKCKCEEQISSGSFSIPRN